MQRLRVLTLVFVLAVLAGLTMQMAVGVAADTPPSEGAVLPDFRLPVSSLPEENEYLGVTSTGYFKIPEVRADIVILEIFNMYCPFCQKEAPNVNQLYRAIGELKNDKTRIRMLGIGVGNSPFEVQTFKRVYSVPFPLFPDNEFVIHNLLGQVRTPHFFGIRINADGSHKVIYSRVGGIGEPREFLQLILKQSKSE